MLFNSSSHDPDRSSREDPCLADDLVGHQALHFSWLEFLLGLLDQILPGSLPVLTGRGSKSGRTCSSCVSRWECAQWRPVGFLSEFGHCHEYIPIHALELRPAVDLGRVAPSSLQNHGAGGMENVFATL